MLPETVAALAGAGTTALLGAAAADAWPLAKRFARLLGRGDKRRAAVGEGRLERCQAELEAPDPRASGAAGSRGGGAPGTGGRAPGPPPIGWNVGPRNPAFIGREDLLGQVRERLRVGGSAVVQALHGLGGVGKTQLAVEYAHRFAREYETVWQIAAERSGLIGDQFAALGVELGIVAPAMDTAAVARVVKAHLRGRSRWLLIFDNAQTAADVREWLPGGAGHVLITSRTCGWAELAARVEVDVLPRPESVALLRAHAPTLSEEEASQLAEALGDLPLGLAQAGGFITETGMSACDYLGLLGTRAAELLDQHPPEGHPRSLAAAILLACGRLGEVDPAALALLRLGAFLAPEPIPAGLLVQELPASGQGPQPELAALAAAAANPVAAHRSLGRLGRYGLARVDHGLLHLHRLTRAIVAGHLGPRGAAAYRAHAERLLVAACPSDPRDPRTWPSWARILPHLLAIDPATSPSPHLRDLTNSAFWYMYWRGDRMPLPGLAQRLHQGWRERLGPDDRHTLQAAGHLVRAQYALGRYRQARVLAEDTHTRSQRMLGYDHPDTLHAAANLARCLLEMGELARGHQLGEELLARRRRTLGENHPDTLESANIVVITLKALGKYAESRQLGEEVLAWRRRTLGEDHPDTLNSANNLAYVMYLQGEAEAARQLITDTLARYRRTLGNDHQKTLYAADTLSACLRALGEAEAAQRLDEDTLARSRRVLGDDHECTLGLLCGLAADLRALGQIEAARRLDEDTLARSRDVLGEEHPDTLAAARGLAADLRALGHADAAKRLDEQALARSRDRSSGNQGE
jgi:hypothetical protein